MRTLLNAQEEAQLKKIVARYEQAMRYYLSSLSEHERATILSHRIKNIQKAKRREPLNA